MMDEISFGLEEAEQTCNFKQLMIDSCQDFLVEGGEENAVVLDFSIFVMRSKNLLHFVKSLLMLSSKCFGIFKI